MIAAGFTPGSTRARVRLPLSLKFAVAFIGLVTFVLVVIGAVDLWQL